MDEPTPRDLDQIPRRLAEAAAWCSRPRCWKPIPHRCIVPPESPCRFAEHRSIELKRRVVAPFVEKSGEEYALATKGPEGADGRPGSTSAAERAAIVADLVQRRSALLGPMPVLEAGTLNRGRLLALLYAFSLAEGACQVESRCFFDVNDTPPWDTWVWHARDVDVERGILRGHSSDCLLAWVPADRLDDVERAIPASSTECVFWASELPGSIGSFLRSAGLA